MENGRTENKQTKIFCHSLSKISLSLAQNSLRRKNQKKEKPNDARPANGHARGIAHPGGVLEGARSFRQQRGWGGGQGVCLRGGSRSFFIWVGEEKKLSLSLVLLSLSPSKTLQKRKRFSFAAHPSLLLFVVVLGVIAFVVVVFLNKGKKKIFEKI